MARRGQKRAPKPFKSWLEYRLATGPLKDWKYEPTKFKFLQPAKGRVYTPDFENSDATVYIEAKGRVSDVDELLKVLWCREQHPEKTFIWVIQRPTARAYRQSKQTLGEWLTSNGFKWISTTDLESKSIEELLNE